MFVAESQIYQALSQGPDVKKKFFNEAENSGVIKIICHKMLKLKNYAKTKSLSTRQIIFIT
jgi:hypothetical protein